MIGDLNDDYFGTDSLRSMSYVYNADNSDFDYGVDPPAFGIVALEEPFTSVLQEDLNWNTINGTWREMNGLMANGQPMVNPDGDTVTFQYGDNPGDQNGWSEETLGNQPGIRKLIMSTDRGVFGPGDTIQQTYAFVYVREGDRLQNVDALLNAADEIHLFYDTIASAQCQDGVLDIQDEELIEVYVAPNPANDKVDVVIDYNGVVKVSIINTAGQVLANKNGQNQIQLDVGSIADGVYLVNIETEHAAIVKRLVVQH